MIKIRVSFIDQEDKQRIIDALEGFKIIHIGKEYLKKGHKNIYIELE